MLVKMIAIAALALVGVPATAQQTGPQGLAEPKLKTPKPPKAPKAGKDAKPAEPVTPAADPANILNMQLSSGGTVSVLLRPDKAPLSVERLKVLANRHFYDGLTFHRVIDGFMAQGGDPKGDGSGGSDLPDLKAEFNDLPHVRGALAMARAQSPDSANSQFYIVLSPTLTLDGNYTVVGRVIAGMAYADALEKGEPPAKPSRIVRAYLGPAPANAATPAAAQAAASAAANTAAAQAAQASLAADEAAKAARRGDTATAGERAKAAQASASSAARAAGDAAEAAGQARKRRR